MSPAFAPRDDTQPRRRPRTTVVANWSAVVFAAAVLSVVVVVFFVRSGQALDEGSLVGVWASNENGGTIVLRGDGTAEVTDVLDRRMTKAGSGENGVRRVETELIERSAALWEIDEFDPRQALVTLIPIVDGKSTRITLFARYSFVGDLELLTVASVDSPEGEQWFAKQ